MQTRAHLEKVRREQQAAEQRRQEERQAEIDRKRAERARRRAQYWSGDRRILQWMIGLLLTVVVPVGIGYLLVRDSFTGETRNDDLGILFAASWFPVVGYLWIVGSAAVAVGVAALLVPRFRWLSRLLALAIAGVLAIVGGPVVLNRDGIAESVLKPARDAFATTHIDVSYIEDLCPGATYWTGMQQPTTAVIAGSDCATLALYFGWDLKWTHVTRGAPVSLFTFMENTYITASGPNAEFLEAFAASELAVVWHKECPTGWILDVSQQDGAENTPANQKLGATCEGKQQWLDPTTGEA
jgi:hypothetical protein